MREMISQYNQNRMFDLFEYTKGKDIIPLLKDRNLSDIINFMNTLKGVHVWIERTANRMYMKQMIEEGGVNIAVINVNAELFMQYTHSSTKMEYIAYWQVNKPEPISCNTKQSEVNNN